MNIYMVSDADNATDLSRPPVGWRTKVVMLSGGLLVALALNGLTVVLPQIEADLAHDVTGKLLIKLLATIVGLTMVAGAPLAGFLIDRVGLRPVLFSSCLLYSLAGTAGFYLSSLSALFASRLLLGLSAAAIATMSMILINTRCRYTARIGDGPAF